MPVRLSWRTMLVGALVLALVIGMVTPLVRQSDKALAAEIVLNSPEFQSALGGEKLDEVRVVNVMNYGTGHMFVVLERSQDLYVVAEVDKETEKVIQVFILEINDELKQEMKDLAGTSPEVQELLEQGAYFRSFSPTFWAGGRTITGPDGEPVELGPIGFMANVTIDLGGRWYYVMVDLSTEEVGSVTDAEFSTYYIFRLIHWIVTCVMAVFGILIMIGAVLRKGLAITLTGVTSYLLGIAGVFSVFFPTSLMAEYWTLIFLPSVTGLAVGITGISKSKSGYGKGIAIFGIVLCSLVSTFAIYGLIYLRQNPPTYTF